MYEQLPDNGLPLLSECADMSVHPAAASRDGPNPGKGAATKRYNEKTNTCNGMSDSVVACAPAPDSNYAAESGTVGHCGAIKTSKLPAAEGGRPW